MNQESKFEKIINDIDLFEERFRTNPEDESLTPRFQEIFEIIKERQLNQEQFKEVHSRLISFRTMFADKKEQLKAQSASLLQTGIQIERYLINSSLRHNK